VDAGDQRGDLVGGQRGIAGHGHRTTDGLQRGQRGERGQRG
jgi:hypothetical protein